MTQFGETLGDLIIFRYCPACGARSLYDTGLDPTLLTKEESNMKVTIKLNSGEEKVVEHPDQRAWADYLVFEDQVFSRVGGAASADVHYTALPGRCVVATPVDAGGGDPEAITSDGHDPIDDRD